MSTTGRIPIFALFFLLPSSVVIGGTSIPVYDAAPTPVRHVIHRLSDYAGIPIAPASGDLPEFLYQLE